MAKKDLKAIIGDLFVDLSPEAMEVKTGKGKKQQVDVEATFQNVTANLAYYGGMLIGLDAIAGDVPGLAEAIAEYKEAHDVLFAYASENLEGFDEYAEAYGLESFGTQEAEDDAFAYIADFERADLVAIAKHFEIKVMKKDDAEAIIAKIADEVEEDALSEALSELGYYEEESDAEEEGEEEAEEEEDNGYADMSLGDLRKECKSRGIKYTPKDKAEALVAKLEEDDANGEEDEESEEEDGAEEVSENELDEILDEEFEDEVLDEEEKASGKGKGGKKLPPKKK